MAEYSLSSSGMPPFTSGQVAAEGVPLAVAALRQSASSTIAPPPRCSASAAARQVRPVRSAVEAASVKRFLLLSSSVADRTTLRPSRSAYCLYH